jgi:hypothetical protein
LCWAVKRIAALMPGGDAPETQQAQKHLIFLENFADEPQRKVPAGVHSLN